MPNLPSLPKGAGLMDLFDRAPALSNLLVPLMEHVMQGPSCLSLGERELLAAYVSALNDCQHCRASRQAAAQALGEDGALIDAALKDIETAPLAARLKPLFKLAYVLTKTPEAMTGAHAAAVLDAGWPEDAILSVVLVTAQFNFMNRLIDGLGLKA